MTRAGQRRRRFDLQSTGRRSRMELSVLRVITTHKARSWGGSLALHLLLLSNAWSRMPRTGQLQALVGGARVGARGRGEERRALSVRRVVAQIVEVAWRQSGLGVLGRRGVPSVQRSLLLLLLLMMWWLLVVHRRLQVQALGVDPALRRIVLLRRVPRRLGALLRVLLLLVLAVAIEVVGRGPARRAVRHGRATVRVLLVGTPLRRLRGALLGIPVPRRGHLGTASQRWSPAHALHLRRGLVHATHAASNPQVA